MLSMYDVGVSFYVVTFHKVFDKKIQPVVCHYLLEWQCTYCTGALAIVTKESSAYSCESQRPLQKLF